MIFGVLLKAAFGGIVASFILAFSRAVGEKRCKKPPEDRADKIDITVGAEYVIFW